MRGRPNKSYLALLCAAGGVLATLGSSVPTQAQDIFSMLFGGLGRQAPRVANAPLGYGSELDESASRPRAPSYGGTTAYCVRTCDGRYFPAPASDRASRASTCQSFCPASETKVYYGGSIDNAVTDKGKAYTDMPNAFRYRDELVSGCSCNGRDGGGLARIDVEKDPTIRNGDIVAGADGLMVARQSDRRGASVNFSPASASIQSKYQRPRILAADR